MNKKLLRSKGILLKRGTGSGERGTGDGSLGTSCQRKPPKKSKMAGKDQDPGKIDDREANVAEVGSLLEGG